MNFAQFSCSLCTRLPTIIFLFESKWWKEWELETRKIATCTTVCCVNVWMHHSHDNDITFYSVLISLFCALVCLHWKARSLLIVLCPAPLASSRIAVYNSMSASTNEKRATSVKCTMWRDLNTLWKRIYVQRNTKLLMEIGSCEFVEAITLNE